MNLPSSLKIGAHDVRVEVRDCWPQDNGNLGEWDVETGTIRIRAGMPDSFTFATLIHEVMHVLNATLDHTVLDGLAEQIAQVLWDNDLIDVE